LGLEETKVFTSIMEPSMVVDIGSWKAKILQSGAKRPCGTKMVIGTLEVKIFLEAKIAGAFLHL